jgi:hypothetical protein
MKHESQVKFTAQPTDSLGAIMAVTVYNSYYYLLLYYLLSSSLCISAWYVTNSDELEFSAICLHMIDTVRTTGDKVQYPDAMIAMYRTVDAAAVRTHIARVSSPRAVGLIHSLYDTNAGRHSGGVIFEQSNYHCTADGPQGTHNKTFTQTACVTINQLIGYADQRPLAVHSFNLNGMYMLAYHLTCFGDKQVKIYDQVYVHLIEIIV